MKYRRMPIEEECPGDWFEQSRRHPRIGYPWPLMKELEGGLAAVSGSIRASLTV